MRRPLQKEIEKQALQYIVLITDTFSVDNIYLLHEGKESARLDVLEQYTRISAIFDNC